jgi:hypothetical protein
MVMKIFTFLLISAVIYFGIAVVLIFFVKPKKPPKTGLTFNELFLDYTGLPELNSFKARDGSSLKYRHCPSQSDKIIILIHVSGWKASVNQYRLTHSQKTDKNALSNNNFPGLMCNRFTYLTSNRIASI